MLAIKRRFSAVQRRRFELLHLSERSLVLYFENVYAIPINSFSVEMKFDTFLAVAKKCVQNAHIRGNPQCFKC